LFPIHRETAHKGKVIPNQWVFEEFLLGHKVKQWLEDEADDRDIGPVLVLGKNDHRSVIRKRHSPLRLDPVKNGKSQLGDAFGHRIDDGIPSCHSFRYAHSACPR
jgi:hypothetical protein